MRRLALLFALAAPASVFAAPADMTPPYCSGRLAGPPPETMEEAMALIRCEQLAAASALEICAAGLRQARADILAVPEPPRRLTWLVLGASGVAAIWAAYATLR